MVAEATAKNNDTSRKAQVSLLKGSNPTADKKKGWVKR